MLTKPRAGRARHHRNLRAPTSPLQLHHPCKPGTRTDHIESLSGLKLNVPTYPNYTPPPHRVASSPPSHPVNSNPTYRQTLTMAPKSRPAGQLPVAAVSTPGTTTTAPPPARKSNSSGQVDAQHIVQSVWNNYVKKTPQRVKLLDSFMGFLVVVGALQFLYCLIVGNFVRLPHLKRYTSAFWICLGF
jgi:hypothetical protein